MRTGGLSKYLYSLLYVLGVQEKIPREQIPEQTNDMRS